MRIAVIGAGSLGLLFGGQLARTGENVTFIARGATLEALQRDGLTVKSPALGDFSLSVTATNDVASVGEVDLVLLAVKTYDLEDAVREGKSLVGASTTILTLQNGIDAAERVNDALGGDYALTGVGFVNAALEVPGVVQHLGAFNRIIVGEPRGGRSARADSVASVLAKAGIEAPAPEDVRVPMWEKFILLAGTGGVLALTRLTLGPIRDSDAMRELFLGAIREAEAVGRALGIAMAPDILESHWQSMLKLPPDARSSMRQDIVTGRRLELESLNGAVVRLGRQLGVPTPLNFAIYAGLEAYTNGPPDAPKA